MASIARSRPEAFSHGFRSEAVTVAARAGKEPDMTVLGVAERVLLCWLAYSFVGWAWETMLGVVLRKRFEDRGVLNGPLCPIYGFGALLVIVLLADVTNPLALFLSSGVLACTLEYLSSWAIEKLFHVRLWDYTGKPLNINGRVYLNGFIAFGAGATLVKLVVQPWLMGVLDAWPPLMLYLVTGVLFLAATVDAAITAAGLCSLDSRLARIGEEIDAFKSEQIEQIDTRIDAANEQWKETAGRLQESAGRLLDPAEYVSQSAQWTKEQADRVLRRLNWQQRRLIRTFPSMTSVRDAHLAARIRALLDRRR